MVKKMREITAGKPEKKDSDATNESPNRGKFIIDDSLPQPTHRYPTDLGLLNYARLHTKKS